ncbi:Golgi transport complex subunit COG3 KNAG_0G01730 [Huiozyma naganishii CBS 8797]|uniref:Conserved oligomeric Golgi complex subunit 3 n=1 Tax=Huiozyma naganishii (strain ATCC MYA-139 / BCRC 22969 / CBS 8797 / KCTC 17520 / NBRC 10181 / NCYC 3082 / Yp74L-3) TaxID=1071383 RepID=J7S913_HUIN7|nr:hypothetical protein KNAG_0G01730 [Kazachstania naganishii CBS 8797]CCK71231.1 hypothetical protein KNAG_0G01730 [Kazachstania naganishii CBS 8797]
MVRARRNSLAYSIASHAVSSDSHSNVSDLLDDTYLFNRLQKLASLVEENSSYEVNETVCHLNELSLKSSTGSNDEDPYSMYTDYLAQLNDSQARYRVVLDQSRKVKGQLDDILEQFNDISSNATKFVNDTRDLFESHDELTKLSEEIPNYLNYFDSLDFVIRKLNHATSPNIVKRDAFRRLLTTIDKSLLFFDAHPNFKDAESYRIKFKQCLVRSCSLILHFTNNLLKQVFSEIMEKNSSITPGTRDALIYNKFSSISEVYAPLTNELTTRYYNPALAKYHDELASLLNDTFNSYFQTRTNLMHPVLWSKLDGILAKDKEMSLFKFTQETKSVFQQLCLNEYKLFVKFFPQGEPDYHQRFNSWLLKFCEPLYSTIRTRISRERDIKTLCDSLNVFASFEHEFEENSVEYRRQFSEVQYNKVFEPVVQRLQDQLINRVKVFVNENLVKYTPSIDDFMVSNRKNEPIDTGSDDMVPLYLSSLRQRYQPNETAADIPDALLLESYYPPTIRVLAILFKLYDVVNADIFDEISHYVIHHSLVSLKKCYALFTGTHNTLEVKLTYMNNLLLLRDEVQNWNVQYNFNDTASSFQFSSVGNLMRSWRWSNSTIFSLAKGLVPRSRSAVSASAGAQGPDGGEPRTGQPGAGDSDSRVELIHELRAIIKGVTDATSGEMVGGVLNLARQGIDLLENDAELRRAVRETLPLVDHKIRSMVSDEEICSHLLQAIKYTCLERYGEYYDGVGSLVESGALDGGALNEIMYVDQFDQFYERTVEEMRQDDPVSVSSEIEAPSRTSNA